MNEYIIHGTSFNNAKKIIKDKKLKINTNKENKIMVKNDIKQIFTQFIFKNIPNQNIMISHYGYIVFVLDKKIMKELPFYAIESQGFFSNSFKNGMKRKDLIAKGNGKMKIMPKLKKLKEEINKYCKNMYYGNVSFMYSHEILFGNDISLRKYCKCIIADDTYKDKLKISIPIIYTNNNIGINNLIKLINIKMKNT